MKTTTKSAFHRGFTLIELMIVIVILGILMGTILPRLTGAQARARDTGRIADLNTIGQALETYFDDNGVYPGTSGTLECLTSASPTFQAIKGYLKGDTVPQPSASQINGVFAGAEGTDKCTGSYAYMPLTNKGIDENGYVLLTDVETYQKANAIITGATTPTLAWPIELASAQTTTVSDGIIDDSTLLKTADDEIATSTVYVVFN